jgi:uncharacterized membrane protein
MRLSDLVRGPPGHPFHPPLTDVTIGAFTFATIAAVLSQLGVAEEQFAHGWWLALIVGLVTSAITAAFGWLDFFTISRGTPLKRTAWTHALTMIAALAVFALAAIFGHGAYEDAEVTAWPFVLTLAGFGLLLLGGSFGGSIVFVHGMRVLNLVDAPTREAVSPLPSEEKERAAE